MRKTVLFLVFTLTAAVLTAQNTKVDAEQDLLDQLVHSKEFRIESQWARPQGGSGVNAMARANLQPPGSVGNRINLMGLFNFLEMRGETVAAILPYFGERQIRGSHYESDNGIQFEGPYRDLIVEQDEKKGSYKISFDVSNDTETFQVNMVLHKNLKSTITVNSNQRYVIRYDGRVMELMPNEQTEGK